MTQYTRNDKIKYVRDNKGMYIINDKPYVSVTTVQGTICGIFESLVENYHCKLCRDYNEIVVNQTHDPIGFGDLHMGIVHAKNDRNTKAEYGKMAHDVLESVFFNGCVILPEFANRVEQIKETYKSLGLELISPETTLYSHKLESAGTADVIAVSRKFKIPRLYIIDYKTGSAQKKKECVQIGAYGLFLIEMIKNKEIHIEGLGDKFTLCGLVIHIGRDDDFKVKTTFFDDKMMKLGAKAYKDLLSYYRFTKTKL